VRVRVAPSWAIRDRIVRLFTSGEPAPARIQSNFRDPGVLAGEARKAMTVRTSAGPRAVRVAPMLDGGFCMGVRGENVCGRSDKHAFAAWPDAVERDGAHVVSEPLIIGYASDPKAAYVEIEYGDEITVRVPLRWISAPIGVGVFVTRVPRRIWANGEVRYSAVLHDADGRQLGREQLTFGSR
jgi:hypothetical protein